MIYFDTSFLVPLVVPEPTSDDVITFMQGLDEAQFAISHWVQVEFSSMIARSVRMRRIESRTARLMNAKFADRVGGFFNVLLPSGDDFNLARDYVMRFETGLKAGDALHLAIASNRNAQAIYSLDDTVIKAGTKLGLPTAGLRAS
jgi:predicted nucleic acid-binding protein